MEESLQPLSRGELPRGEVMQTPDEVAAMLRLKGLGWGIKRIARELGCSHMTVRHYVAQGGWLPYRGSGRRRVLAGLEDWVAERFRRHAGNADVVRQELLAEKGLKLSLRTVERAVAALRRELEAEARATIRFETPPGKQLQIYFGERRVLIGGESVKVYLFVATLGYSRRVYVRAFRNERQESWFAGLEGAFGHFGGVTEEVLFDNDRRLVVRHDRATVVCLDAQAVRFIREGIERGFDGVLSEAQLDFFYLPLMHSESLSDHDLLCERGRGNDPDALQHREIIARFGRYPHRNAVLGRDSTSEEASYLTGPHASF